MKKRTINFFAGLTALSLMTMSCHKDNAPAAPVPVPGNKKQTLIKVEKDAYLNSSLDYNAKGQVKLINRVSNGMSYYCDLIYTTAGQLAEIKYTDYRVLFYYAGQKLLRTATINIHQDPQNTEPESYGAVTWTGNNITEIREYFFRDSDEVNFRKSTFTYYPNGDLHEFGSWNFIPEQDRYVREFAESFTYDDKRSPWPGESQNFPLLYSPYNELEDFLPSVHNVRTQTSYWESGEPYAVRTFNYTYNVDGYPQSAVSTWDFMDPRDATITDTLHYSYLPVNEL